MLQNAGDISRQQKKQDRNANVIAGFLVIGVAAAAWAAKIVNVGGRVLQCVPGYLWRRCRAYRFLWLRKYRREPHGLPGKERQRNHRAALSFWCRYAAGRRTTVFCAHSFQRLPSLHGFRLDDAHNRRSPLLRGMYPYTGNGGRFRGRWQSLRGWRFPAAAVHRPVIFH